jgi:small subunit ribosomal protein S2
MPQIPTLLEMLKAGVHFGHQKAKWHPKMRQYIYTVRHGVHILDLEKTTHELELALKFIQGVVAGGGTILFTGLKEQADKPMREAAKRTNMPYIIGRWLGGVFTNFGVISKLLRRLDTLESEKNAGIWEEKYSKKEQLERQRDFEKLEESVGGIRNLTKLPQAVFLVGTREAKNAIREARKVGVPIVALVDTNTNPSLVDYPIPANDDALRSIEMIVGLAAEAVIEGQKQAASVAVDTVLK